MSKRERQAYREGQINLIKGMLGFTALAIMFATMFGQAFLF